MDKAAIGMGKKINSVRKSKGITADRLADLCEINAAYLRQIEGGRKLPSLPLFIQLCNALEVSPSYLLQDAIPHTELDNWPELSALWKDATPEQLKLATAMIKAALECTSSRQDI